MTQRQHGTAQTSLRMSSTISSSCFFHSFTSLSYFSRVYSWAAALAFASSASRSALYAFAFSAAVTCFVCSSIRCSRQCWVWGGDCGQAHGWGHSGGSLNLGGVVAVHASQSFLSGGWRG